MKNRLPEPNYEKRQSREEQHKYQENNHELNLEDDEEMDEEDEWHMINSFNQQLHNKEEAIRVGKVQFDKTDMKRELDKQVHDKKIKQDKERQTEDL